MGHKDTILNGVKLPSVTEILGVIRKPYLERWRGALGNRECDAIQKQSTDIGHKFHEAVEKDLQGIAITLEPEVAKMFFVWKEWADKNKLNCLPEHIEKTVISTEHQYAGSPDAIGFINNDPTLILFDWKTSNRVDFCEYAMQLSAYAQAIKETLGIELKDGRIVRVDKPFKVEKITLEDILIEDLPSHFDDFLAAKRLFNRCKKYK